MNYRYFIRLTLAVSIPAFFPFLFRIFPFLLLPYLLWWNVGVTPFCLIDKIFGIGFFRISEFGVVLTNEKSIPGQILASALAVTTWIALAGTVIVLRERLKGPLDKVGVKIFVRAIVLIIGLLVLATIFLPLVLQ